MWALIPARAAFTLTAVVSAPANTAAGIYTNTTQVSAVANDHYNLPTGQDTIEAVLACNKY